MNAQYLALDTAEFRQQIIHALDRLLAEFGPQLAAGIVVRSFTAAARELRAAGVRHGLPTAAEAMARRRLQDRIVRTDQVA
jgi:hypothetical protein